MFLVVYFLREFTSRFESHKMYNDREAD